MVAMHKKYIIEIVDDIKAVSGRNEKVAILTQALQENQNFRTATELAYNPYKNFFISSNQSLLDSLHKVNFGSPRGYRDIQVAFHMLEAINEHGSAPNDMKNRLYNKMVEIDEQDVEAVDLILKGSFDCGISVSSINKAYPGLIPEFKTMLCEKLSKKSLEKIVYPAYAQVKMDGMRTLMFIDDNKITFRSRSGKHLEVLGAFDNEINRIFPAGTNCVVDGELITVTDGKVDPRKTSNGICNKALKGTISEDEARKLVFVAWDVFSQDTFWAGEGKTPYVIRFEMLKGLISKGTGRIRLVENIEVEDYAEVNRYFQKNLEKGEEGIILKNKNSLYTGKRSRELIKFKAEKTADLEIVEVLEGAGKYTGQLGAFSCTTKDGDLRVNVGSGFSDQDRSDMFTNSLVGQIVEVKYNEVIEDKFGDASLFLPVFVGLRKDKKEANLLKEL